MSNVKQVAELRTAQELAAAVAAFKAVEGWREDLALMWQAIREAALEQFAMDKALDPVAGGDSY
jgi:hypothetical protein